MYDSIEAPQYTMAKKFKIDESIPPLPPKEKDGLTIAINQHPNYYNKDTFNTDEFVVEIPKMTLKGNDVLRLLYYMHSIGITPNSILLTHDGEEHFGNTDPLLFL